MATIFPTTLQDLDATRGTSTQALNSPSHVTHHALEDDTLEALQAKVGVDSSAVATSIDYILKNTSSSNPGHKHTLVNGATDVIATATELNYVGGVTSAIQTQMNLKAPLASPTFTGTATFGSGVLVATTPVINGGVTGSLTLPLTAFGAGFVLPQGVLFNGKIVPTVSANDLILTITGSNGNALSASNPAYLRIGDTVVSLTAPLSVTMADGTNWFGAGGAGFATKEIDYFVYLGYNATDGVVIGVSRIPYGRIYSDFSATNTNEKFCAISTITTAAATDAYVNIGRFPATLSAGAGYTWTVPTFTWTNLFQRPIYETRWLNYIPVIGQGASTDIAKTVTYAKYKISENKVEAIVYLVSTAAGTAGSNILVTTPTTAIITTTYGQYGTGEYTDSGTAVYYCTSVLASTTSIALGANSVTTTGALIGTTPAITVASGDIFESRISYEF